MLTISEREENPARERAMENRRLENKMRVAIPGIIQSFDSDEQTVTVRPALREKVNIDGDETWMEIPLLVDVPVVLPRAGGYTLTMPVQPGDECIVVFGDMCIDAWWQSGGLQNQIDCRRHDLSDGFAILGPWSQPRVLPNYSTTTAQLRNDAGDAYVEISGSNINIVASGNINIRGANVYIN